MINKDSDINVPSSAVDNVKTSGEELASNSDLLASDASIHIPESIESEKLDDYLEALKKKREQELADKELAKAISDALPLDPSLPVAGETTVAEVGVAVSASTLGGGAGASAGAAAGGAAASGAVGAAGAAAGAAGAAGAAAATAATAAATTTAAAASSALSLPTVAAVGGGVALAAGGAGGGGGGGGTPIPEPAGNPFPGTDDETLDPNGSDPSVVAVHRLSLASGQPNTILNKSLVIDLGATSGDLKNTLFLTQKIDGVVQTKVVAYSGLSNVTGTSVNDQITGSVAANLIDGGAGDDVIYGAGGNDTLAGGDGVDWVLFSPLTRTSGSNVYSSGITIDLSDNSVTASGLTGLTVSGFENVYGTSEGDTITGSNDDNILAGGAGDDSLDGGLGDDTLIAGTSVSGDSLTGGAGSDYFLVGYDINPATRSRLLAGGETTSNTDLFDLLANSAGLSLVLSTATIEDWDFANDDLSVSYKGVAVIGGLYGTAGWSGNDVVNVSNADNKGVIQIAAGDGTNTLTLSSGRDEIISSGTDKFYAWDDSTGYRDTLTVQSSAIAVIAGRLGQADWTTDDVVDLRGSEYVDNNGSIYISAEKGSNTLYGSSGVDRFYGSSEANEINQIWAGSGLDEFYVGYRLDVSDLTDDEVASTDILWDYDDTEVLKVSASGLAIIGGLSGYDWTIANSVDLSGGNVTNGGRILIALGNSNDVFEGSSGDDTVYGGLSTTGNQIWGGTGDDHFVVGYNFDPLTGALVEANGRSNLGPTELGTDVIRDWDNANDALTVGARGRAVIGGLSANGFSNWAGNDSIDISGATNDGEIILAAGAGTNKLELSAGVDKIYVGYQYDNTLSAVNGSVAPSEISSGTASDVLYGWDDQTDKRDALTVGGNDTASIGTLLNKTHWDNDDTVDLREQVYNSGLINIAAGLASNTIFLSSGSDHVHTGYELDTGATVSVGAGIDYVYGWDARDWTDAPLSGTFYSGTNWNGETDTNDTTYDRLTVAAGSTVRLESLAGMTASDDTRWDGVDIIDLRSNVNNQGVIEIWSGADSDNIFGSSGVDYIYSGPGLDNVWGGEGNDVFYVGYSPSWAAFGADAAEPRIWDWQNPTANKDFASNDERGADVTYSNGTGVDSLRIAAGSFTIIKGVYGMDPTDDDRWDGDDIVDVSGDVINNGKIIIETSYGDDDIFGSTGVDYINAGSGRNDIELGNGGADRVYIDSYQSKTQITGFGSDDKIYLEQRVLESFIQARSINLVPTYDITATDTDTGSVSDGQGLDNGSWFTSEKLYDVTYQATLKAYSADPKDPDFSIYTGNNGPLFDFGWASNGAWNNGAYNSAYDPNGKGAVIAAGAVSILVGNGLAGIPFVGPLLAIPFWVNGGMMLNDGINNVTAYQNPFYSGAYLDSGISILSPDYNSADSGDSTVGVWDDKAFLDFYDVYVQQNQYGFAPSLEIGGQQSGYEYIDNVGVELSGGGLSYTSDYWQAPQLDGIASYLAVYNEDNDETFIYLVASQDSLIQNNETILLAQVNGQVTEDQLVIYDGSSDAEYLRYFDNTVEAPVFAPEATIDYTSITPVTSGKQVIFEVSYQVGTEDSNDSRGVVLGDTVKEYLTRAQLTAKFNDSSIHNLAVNQVLTDDASLSISIQMDKLLTVADTVTVKGVVVYQSGSAINGATVAEVDGVSVLTANVSVGSTNGDITVPVTVSNGDFTSENRTVITVDNTAISSDDLTVTSADGSLTVTLDTQETAYVSFASGNAVTLDGSNSYNTTFTLSAGTAGEKDLVLTDLFGRQSSLTDLAYVGSTGNDSYSGDSLYIYGFGGNDTLTPAVGSYDSEHDEMNSNFYFIYAGDGNDTITSSKAGSAIVAGSGGDTLNLSYTHSSGENVMVLEANNGSNSDSFVTLGSPVDSYYSNASFVNADLVNGFNSSRDTIYINATGFSNFDMSTDIYFTTIPTGENDVRYLLSYDLDGDGNKFEASDIVMEFNSDLSGVNWASITTLNITGTSANDSLTGGSGNDVLTGGAGNDSLSAGTGNNTLNGGAGKDSLTAGSGNDIFKFAAGDSDTNSYDIIYGVDLTDGTNTTTSTSFDQDTIDLQGVPSIVADTTGSNGTDAGVIKSHKIVDGIITFDDQDSYGSALSSSEFGTSDAITYIKANITGDDFDGATVAFNFGADAFVFQNNETANTDDLFIMLDGTNISGLTNNISDDSVNYLYIA